MAKGQKCSEDDLRIAIHWLRMYDESDAEQYESCRKVSNLLCRKIRHIDRASAIALARQQNLNSADVFNHIAKFRKDDGFEIPEEIP